LRLLFEDDDRSKVVADQIARIRLILAALKTAGTVQDMNQPTFRLHPLKGEFRSTTTEGGELCG
jgi:toxin HigB-1